MEPISLILIALFASAAAAVALLSWETLNSFIRSKGVPTGSATVIKKRLASGNYSIVVGVFNGGGTKIASNTWKAESLDRTLSAKFGGRNVLQIRT